MYSRRTTISGFFFAVDICESIFRYKQVTNIINSLAIEAAAPKGTVIERKNLAELMEVAKNQMLKGGISQPRNKGLFKMFNLIGYGEHAGSGVPDIFQAWKDAGLDAPIVEEMYGGGTPDRTILTLPLDSNNLPIRQSADSADSADLKERHQQILSVMESGKEYRSDEISELVGLKGSRTRQLLKELIDIGKIETNGSTRGKRYVKHEAK